jgi:hypothetical protein
MGSPPDVVHLGEQSGMHHRFRFDDRRATTTQPQPPEFHHRVLPPTLHGPWLSDVRGGPGRNTARVARIEERRELNLDFLRGVAGPQRNLNKYGLFE